MTSKATIAQRAVVHLRQQSRMYLVPVLLCQTSLYFL